MSVQNGDYQYKPEQAYDGLVSDMNPGIDISRNVETAAGIAFGRVVSKGTSDGQCIIGGDDALGVSVRELNREGEIYVEKAVAAIRSDGLIYATVEGIGAYNDALTYDNVTGIFSTDAAGGTKVAINAKLKETKAGATAAVVEVELQKV